MIDIEKTKKGLRFCSSNCNPDCPYYSEVHSCMRHLFADAVEIMDNIAAMQCALDKANEKLAYLSGEDRYHYDCEFGREQLNAWLESWKDELSIQK